MTSENILVESAEGVAVARRHGIGSGTCLYTHSPFVHELLSRENVRVEWLQDGLLPDAPEQIGYAAVRAVDLLQPVLKAIGEELRMPAAIVSISITLQRTIAALLYKKALLDSWRLRTPGQHIVIGCSDLTPSSGPDVTLARFDTLFAVFAKREGEVWPQLLEMPPIINLSRFYAEIDQGHWLDRVISFADLSRSQLTYRLFHRLCRNRPLGRKNRGPNVTVFFLNEVIREMLPELLRAGARISFHTPRRPKFRAGEAPSALPSKGRLLEILKEATRELEYLNVGPVADILAERLHDSSCFWRSAIEDMEKEANSIVSKIAPDIVLSNSTGGFLGECLVASLRQRNIKIVLAEHGVSAGLCGLHESVRPYGEPRGADAYLVCSKNTAEFFECEDVLRPTVMLPIGLPNQTRTVPVGRLQRFLVRRRFSVLPNQRLIIFVTSPFQNTMRLIPHTPEDPEIHEITRAVVHDVLPHVRGVPVVKLYPTRRHLDPDPLSGAFPPPASVNVCKAGDFRYMRAAADIIILDFPLSTLGWAFGSGKPIVFLYHPRWHLLPGIETALASALFLIRTDSSDWIEKLTGILNWDAETLKRTWDAKEDQRRHVLDRYIFGPENPAKSGAEFVVRLANDENPIEGMAA